jgi:hypothetical protein
MRSEALLRMADTRAGFAGLVTMRVCSAPAQSPS